MHTSLIQMSYESEFVHFSLQPSLEINSATVYFNVQCVVLVLGTMVVNCIPAGVSRTQHIPVHLACWTSVLCYQCLYSLSIINFILPKCYSKIDKTVVKATLSIHVEDLMHCKLLSDQFCISVVVYFNSGTVLI